MTQQFRIYQAVVGDGADIGRIHGDAWEAAYRPFFAPGFFATAVAERRAKWDRRLAEAKDTVLLAAPGEERPVCYSCFGATADQPGTAEVHGFYAHPSSWGTGVAPALMTATLSALRAAGFADVRVWTLRDTPQSRRFYQKCGFTESGATRLHDFGDGRPLAQVEYTRTL